MGARALMFQGTSSHAGKSVIAAGAGRWLRRRGIQAVPFKALNMSNNAWVDRRGREMAMAQAVQARACGLAPEAEMNPVLLKPTGDRTSQVILTGRPAGTASAADLPLWRSRMEAAVTAALTELTGRFEFLIAEGAGSPAEINLRDWDLANMFVARRLNCPVVLIGDIERGGLFAQMVGTLELLEPADRDQICGFIVNKFRGDPTLLASGLKWLEQRTGKPVFGVVPYLESLNLEEEDAVADRLRDCSPWPAGALRIGVIAYPTISNFTDLNPFHWAAETAVRYWKSPPAEADLPHVLILPGSKSVVSDLAWMRHAGLDQTVRRCVERGIEVIGLCGGFQMLGDRILDPDRVESDVYSAEGLGWLPTSTLFAASKITAQVRAQEVATGLTVQGYEIHAGRIRGLRRGKVLFRILERRGAEGESWDGCRHPERPVWGTLLHGLFENDRFRAAFLGRLRRTAGLSAPAAGMAAADPMDVWSDHLAAAVDWDRLLERIGWNQPVGR
ncbi:MAG: cobyric acid synthase CobQ [Candidatus Omnitrophica bacterium CG11_big_fil_rev_8_21_14_0_20_64_10]|nr:MAG: cobyric acid synthase CobQ [Candidatus Omnitrophica bacterium CG11_big_fil_rev_8_21_14_0_20_64_10]